MKKNKILGYIILTIIFVFFNIIAFVVPTYKTLTFWIAYVFTTIAFITQIFIWKVAFNSAETLKIKFLSLQIIHIGLVYLIVQVITFAIFMAVPIIPSWIAIIVFALIAGISAICIISSQGGKDEIKRVEEKVQQKTMFIKKLQSDIEFISHSEQDAEVKQALSNLAESVRYSDPMSNQALSQIEASITEKVDELKTSDNRLTIINDINTLLFERNIKCKMLK